MQTKPKDKVWLPLPEPVLTDSDLLAYAKWMAQQKHVPDHWSHLVEMVALEEYFWNHEMWN